MIPLLNAEIAFLIISYLFIPYPIPPNKSHNLLKRFLEYTARCNAIKEQEILKCKSRNTAEKFLARKKKKCLRLQIQNNKACLFYPLSISLRSSSFKTHNFKNSVIYSPVSLRSHPSKRKYLNNRLLKKKIRKKTREELAYSQILVKFKK